MLIDEYLPRYDVFERHATVVCASTAQVYAALRTADLAACPVVRLLLALRTLPAALRDGRSGVRRLRARLSSSITLSEFEAQGFTVLAEAPPRELVMGLAGTFWTLRGGMRPIDARTFQAPQLPGTARAAWNFAIEEGPNGCCRLTTETRVQCADAASRRLFRPYWWVIRPGSSLIRHCMLRAIRKKAERETTDPGTIPDCRRR